MKSQKQTIATKDATFSKQMAKAMMPFAECYAAFLESRGIKPAEQYIEAYGDASDPPPIGAAPVVGHGDSDVQGVSKGGNVMRIGGRRLYDDGLGLLYTSIHQPASRLQRLPQPVFRQSASP